MYKNNRVEFNKRLHCTRLHLLQFLDLV